MKNIVLSTITSVLIGSKIICQTIEPSSGIKKTSLQLEFETLYSIEKINSEKNTSWSIPNILIRYGLSDNIEL